MAALGGLALLTVVLALRPTGAGATVLVELGVAELTRGAEAVVHGTVIRVGSRLHRRRAEPETLVEVRVARRLAGAAGPVVRLRERGGSSGGRTVRVHGVPTFAPGEEVVVFLERRPSGRRDLRTLGMAQGKLRVVRGQAGEALVARDLGDVALVRAPVCAPPFPRTLEALVREVARLRGADR